GRAKSEDLWPVTQLATGDFADHEWMSEDLFPFERLNERRYRPVQMIDPDGGIDEDQAGRRRRGAFARGSLPPRRASRLALSRAIRARRPSWIRAVRSCVPVRRRASSISRSS